MEIIYTEPFKRDYGNLPLRIQRALEKALRFLMQDIRYPSLRVKKLPSTSIWYARITKAYRCTFYCSGNSITLRRAGTYAILNDERARK